MLIEIYFSLFFTMQEVGNLDKNLVGYFKLSFIMVKLSNLDANLEGYLIYFIEWQKLVIV